MHEGKRMQMFCFEIKLSLQWKRGQYELGLGKETVISFIVLGSLSFIGPKEKPANESIEACQTLEDNLSCVLIWIMVLKCVYTENSKCMSLASAFLH